MKTLKKITALIAGVMLIAGLSGCSSEKKTVTKAIENALTAFKNMDTEGMKKYFDGKEVADITEEQSEESKIYTNKLSWKIGDITINSENNTATAAVKITTVDMEDVYNKAFINGDGSEDAVKKAEESSTTKDFDVTVTLDKKDNDYVISSKNDALNNALSGGLIDMYTAMLQNMFSMPEDNGIDITAPEASQNENSTDTTAPKAE